MTGNELYTRCPTCKTVFRTHDAQLAVQSGKVRCGQCRMVFDGRAHLVDLLPEPHAGAEEERTLGPPTVTLRDSLALQPAGGAPTAMPSVEPAPAAGVAPPVAGPVSQTTAETAPAQSGIAVNADVSARGEPFASATSEAVGAEEPSRIETAGSNAAVSRADTSHGETEEIVAYDWRGKQKRPPRPGMRWAFGIATVLLLLLLAGQAIFQFRHAIAASYPRLRPQLVAACAAFGCTVDAIRRRDEITIESHDLQADPAHQGLLILQLTLRNHAGYPVAFPHLELEILDVGGQPQARRALAPVDYAGGAADFSRGMPANAEWNVKLFIDASSIGARGYNLDLFYP